MKSTLNLRHIEAFRAVMLTGTVVGAAQLMNVTQPAVSRTLALMETRLGFALFERRGRRLVPTAEAESLYREIEQLYSGIERIGQIALDIRFQRAGALRVATLPALAHSLVPRAITAFLAQRPGVHTFVQSLPSRQIAELVSTRQFDVGVIELPLTRPGIVFEHLPHARSVVVLPAGHRLAAKRSLSVKDLDGEKMILLSQVSYVRYQIDDAFSGVSASPNIVVETPSSSIACAFVAAGAGITIVSPWTAETFAGAGIVLRPLKETLASRHALIYPEGRADVALAKAFAQELRQAIAQEG